MVSGDIPVKKEYEDEYILAFADINPQAPIHILIIPKIHKTNVLNFTAEDATLLTKIFACISYLAKKYNLAEQGFRVVVNTGPDAGQAVEHVHFHFLGGRGMHWPPG
jgi:histidine triad (HIT) family protein